MLTFVARGQKGKKNKTTECADRLITVSASQPRTVEFVTKYLIGLSQHYPNSGGGGGIKASKVVTQCR